MTFGSIPRKVSELQNELAELRKDLGGINFKDQVKKLEKELNSFLALEEYCWKQRCERSG